MTGEILYSMYVRLLDERYITVKSWCDLTAPMQMVWNELATSITDRYL